MAQVINLPAETDVLVGSFAGATVPQPDDLIVVGNPLPIDEGITVDDVAGDTIYERGQVMGIITATGKYGKYDDAAVDGRAQARCILGRSIDITTNEQAAFAYFGGRFNLNKVIGSAAGVVDSQGIADLRAAGIYLETVSAY